MSNTPQGSGSAPRIPDRQHVRQRVSSLEYIELGPANGGIVLNIGEGGMAITSAMPLTSLELPNIRFRVPGSDHWIETGAQVAWTAVSRKEAGLRFVQMKQVDQDRIKSWVALRAGSQTSVVASPPVHETRPEPPTTTQASLQSDAEPQTAPVPPVIPEASVAANVPPSPDSQANIPNASATPLAGEAAPLPPSQIPVDTSPRGWAVLEYHGENPEETFAEPKTPPSSIWLKIIVLIAAVAVISFALGSAAGKNMWNQLTGALFGSSSSSQSSSRQSTDAAGPGNPVESTPPPPRGAYNTTPDLSSGPPPAATPEIPSGPDTNLQSPQESSDNYAGKDQNGASENGSVLGTAPPSRSKGLSPEASDKAYSGKHSPARDENLSNKSPSAAIPHSSGEPPADPGDLRKSPSAPETQPPVSNPAPSGPPDAGEASPPISSSPSSTSHDFPGTNGTVEVISNPYPSPRVPMGVLSQPRSKSNLQIGPVQSRVEPLYPLEAAHQHLEGTVKLHVLIGLNGAVDRVELKSGPILLANAARVAVQQWRYRPTLLRGIPVESEEDITVVFRLSHTQNSGR